MRHPRTELKVHRYKELNEKSAVGGCPGRARATADSVALARSTAWERKALLKGLIRGSEEAHSSRNGLVQAARLPRRHDHMGIRRPRSFRRLALLIHLRKSTGSGSPFTSCGSSQTLAYQADTSAMEACQHDRHL